MQIKKNKQKTKLDIKDFKKLPNIISTLRFFASLFILITSFTGFSLLFIQILYVLAAFSDKADGIIARRFKWETKLGLYLEGIADGSLIFATIVFIALRTDFPGELLTYAFVLFLTGTLFVLFTYIKTKRWFSVILPVNRVAVFVSHTLIIFFVFSIPFRQELAILAYYLGLLMLAYYIYMIIHFNFTYRAVNKSNDICKQR